MLLPTVAEKFAPNGTRIIGGAPEQFAEYLRSDTAKWDKVNKAAGIKSQ